MVHALRGQASNRQAPEGFSEAKAEAERINAEVVSSAGFSTPDRYERTGGQTVRGAVLETIKQSGARDRSKRDSISRFNAFSEFLTARHPRAQRWSDITAAIIDEFVSHSREAGLAHDTVRLRLAPLRMTARRMARLHPDRYRDVTAGLRLRRDHPPRSEDELNAILSPRQLVALLRWLRENAPMHWVWGRLQGLAGLRGYEAAYLREQDVDLGDRTVRVAESPAHRPKNTPSYRKLPVCDMVRDALSVWIDGMARRHPDGYLFFPRQTEHQKRTAKDAASMGGAYCMDYVSRSWTRVLKRAREEGVDLPDRFVARKLRATFATAMRSLKADYADVQRYLGQTVPTVLSRHYDHVGRERLAAVAELAQRLLEEDDANGAQD